MLRRTQGRALIVACYSGMLARMPTYYSRKWLILLLVGAFAIRIGFCTVKTGLGRTLERDYREYVIAGERLAKYGTLVSPFILADTDRTPSAVLPPAYAGFVAVVYRLLGAETFAATLALQLVNALATSLCVLGAFHVALRISGPACAWVAAALVAVNPAMFGFTHLIWDTSLFALGVVLAVLLGVRLCAGPANGWKWFGYGLWLGGLALLNPALTIGYPFLVLWPLSKSHGWRIGPLARGVALCILGWMVAVAPWTVRNYHHFDKLMYIRSGLTMQLWLGVCPEADSSGGAAWVSQFPLKNDDIQRQIVAMGEQRFIESRGRMALDAISQDPGRWGRLVVARTVDFWAGTVLTHAPLGGGWPRSSLRAGVAIFMLGEVILLVVCLGVGGRTNADLRWLLAVIVSFSLVYCLTHVQLRFRAPIEPIVAVLLAAAAAQAYTRLRGRVPQNTLKSA